MKIFGKNMQQDLLGDVSGDYANLLVSLLKDPSERTFEGPSEPEVPHEIVEVPEPVIEQTPTLKAALNFNPESDCERLRKVISYENLLKCNEIELKIKNFTGNERHRNR
jgi:hypothetical protein